MGSVFHFLTRDGEKVVGTVGTGLVFGLFVVILHFDFIRA